MKQTFLLILTFAVLLFGCTKSEINEEFIPQNGNYTGTLVVDQNDGTEYTDDSVSVEVIINTDNTVDITMKAVKFSSKMPVTLDMTIKNVPYSVNGKEMVISGTDLIPWAMGGEFPRYIITDLTGSISDQTIILKMSCGGYPIDYNGITLSDK